MVRRHALEANDLERRACLEGEVDANADEHPRDCRNPDEPASIPPVRHTGYELQRWQVTLVIERARLQSNGEIALELYDIPSSTYMNAYMPNPHCLSAQTRDRKAILSARRVFVRDCKLPPTYAGGRSGQACE